MNYFYENVPELQLPDHIQQQLISLDRNSLRINDLCLANGKEVFVGLSYDSLERLDFASEQYNYELGSIITWYLSADLEQAVLDHYADFFGLFSEPPAIRLQYIFGSGVAVHIDQIRSSSIIHPLLNHANTFTRFYEHKYVNAAWRQHYSNIADPSWPPCKSIKSFEYLPLHIQQEILTHDGSESILSGINLSKNLPGLDEYNNRVVPPNIVELVDQVEIKNYPCLLNVRHPHDVYLHDIPDSNNGRLSLYWKFSNEEFSTVRTAYHQYVQSKI